MDIPIELYSAMRINFLYVDRYMFRENWIYPDSYIPYCMLRYITKGTATFIIDGEEIVVSAGDIAYIPEGCMLECHTSDDVVEFISIRFTTSMRLKSSDLLAEFFHLPYITKDSHTDLYELFNEILYYAQSPQASRFFRIRGNLELILAALIERTEETWTNTEERQNYEYTLESIRKREQRSSSIKRDLDFCQVTGHKT